MRRMVNGVVHGRRIDLAEDPGFDDGQNVHVTLSVVRSRETWGEGIRRSAGGWADYPEMDAVMDQIQRDRKRDRQLPVME